MLQPKPTPPSSFFFFLCFLFTCSLRCSFFLTSSFFKLYLHPVALVHDPLGATCSSPITTADVGIENVRMGLFNKDLSRRDDGTGMHGTQFPDAGSSTTGMPVKRPSEADAPGTPRPLPPVLSSPLSPLPQNTVELSHISLLSGDIDRKNQGFFPYCGDKFKCEVRCILNSSKNY